MSPLHSAWRPTHWCLCRSSSLQRSHPHLPLLTATQADTPPRSSHPRMCSRQTISAQWLRVTTTRWTKACSQSKKLGKFVPFEHLVHLQVSLFSLFHVIILIINMSKLRLENAK